MYFCSAYFWLFCMAKCMALARIHTPWKFRNTPRSCMHIEKLTNELVIRILPSIPIPVITFDKNWPAKRTHRNFLHAQNSVEIFVVAGMTRKSMFRELLNPLETMNFSWLSSMSELYFKNIFHIFENDYM